jgi:hypothetical protein
VGLMGQVATRLGFFFYFLFFLFLFSPFSKFKIHFEITLKIIIIKPKLFINKFFYFFGLIFIILFIY